MPTSTYSNINNQSNTSPAQETSEPTLKAEKAINSSHGGSPEVQNTALAKNTVKTLEKIASTLYPKGTQKLQASSEPTAAVTLSSIRSGEENFLITADAHEKLDHPIPVLSIETTASRRTTKETPELDSKNVTEEHFIATKKPHDYNMDERDEAEEKTGKTTSTAHENFDNNKRTNFISDPNYTGVYTRRVEHMLNVANKSKILAPEHFPYVTEEVFRRIYWPKKFILLTEKRTRDSHHYSKNLNQSVSKLNSATKEGELEAEFLHSDTKSTSEATTTSAQTSTHYKNDDNFQTTTNLPPSDREKSETNEETSDVTTISNVKKNKDHAVSSKKSQNYQTEKSKTNKESETRHKGNENVFKNREEKITLQEETEKGSKIYREPATNDQKFDKTKFSQFQSAKLLRKLIAIASKVRESSIKTKPTEKKTSFAKLQRQNVVAETSKHLIKEKKTTKPENLKNKEQKSRELDSHWVTGNLSIKGPYEEILHYRRTVEENLKDETGNQKGSQNSGRSGEELVDELTRNIDQKLTTLEPVTTVVENPEENVSADSKSTEQITAKFDNDEGLKNYVSILRRIHEIIIQKKL